MANGAPRVTITEKSLGLVSTSPVNVPAAMVIDSERGVPGELNFSGSIPKFKLKAGLVDPFKYGIGVYSALNHLTDSNQLYWVRVDRGQTYGSVLVRHTVRPMITVDGYGALLEKPVIDPVVFPYMSLTKAEIDNFNFPEYEVGGVAYVPAVQAVLTYPVFAGSTTFYIDNMASFKAGERIAIPIETGEGMARVSETPDNTTGIGSGAGDIPWDAIGNIRIEDADGFELESWIPRENFWISTIKSIGLKKEAIREIEVGFTETRPDIDQRLEVMSAVEVVQHLPFLGKEPVNIIAIETDTNGDSVFVLNGGYSRNLIAGDQIEAPNMEVRDNGVLEANRLYRYYIKSVSADGRRITTEDKFNPQVLNYYPITENSWNVIYDVVPTAGPALINRTVTSLKSYAPKVYIEREGLVKNSFVVNNNDSIVEGSKVVFMPEGELEGMSTVWTGEFETVQSKRTYEREHFRVDVDTPLEFLGQSSGFPEPEAFAGPGGGIPIGPGGIGRNTGFLNAGSEVLKLRVDTLIQKDNFLAYPASPGGFSKDSAFATRKHPTYADAFFIDYYEKGERLESFAVSKKRRLDGNGRQMYLETVVNSQSEHFRVKDNLGAYDVQAEAPIMPLMSDYYVRQKAPILHWVTHQYTGESIWNGDVNIIILAGDEDSEVGATDIYELQRTFKVGDDIRVGDQERVIAGVKVIEDFMMEHQSGEFNDTRQAISITVNKPFELERELRNGTPVELKKDIVFAISVRLVDGDGEFGQNLPEGTTEFIFGETIVVVEYQENQTVASALADIVLAINKTGKYRAATDVRIRNGFLVESAQGNQVFTYESYSRTYGLGSSFEFEMNVHRDQFKSKEVFAPEVINNAVVPNLTIDSLTSFKEGKYFIRDAGANRFLGGNDGELPSLSAYINAAQVFRNRRKVDIVTLLDAGVNVPAYQIELDDIARSRADCVGFFATPYEVAANPNEQAVIDYRNSLGLDSSWSCLFNPWVEVYDPATSSNIWLPVESDASRALARVSVSADHIWGSIAGWNNGKISRALSVSQEYDEGQEGRMYDSQVNNVRVDTNGRRAMFGQKTLEVEETPTNSINVRMTAIMIGRQLRDYLESVQFQVNTEDTRRTHKENAETFMERFKTDNAVYDYLVVCDETNNSEIVVDSKEMYLDIGFKPTRLSEYLFGRLTVTPTSRDFVLI